MKRTSSILLLALLLAPLRPCAFSGETNTIPAAPTAPKGLQTLEERRAGILAGKQKEWTESVAERTRYLAKLPSGTTTVLDLPYVEAPAEGMLPGSGQTLDLYVPSGAGPFPLVIVVHGGAWKGGDKSGWGATVAASFVPEGFAVASINYRCVFDAPFPGMFQDAIDSVAFLRAHAEQYHLDASRIGIFGNSAGSDIGGVVAMAEGGEGAPYVRVGPGVQAAVLWCGFYDMTRETGQYVPGKFIGSFVDNPRDDFAYLYPNRTYDPQIAKQMSPLYLIHPGIPPVLLVRGDQDTIAPLVQSEIFEGALKEAGAEVAFTHYPTYTHGLWHSDSVAETLAFFKKHLQGR